MNYWLRSLIQCVIFIFFLYFIRVKLKTAAGLPVLPTKSSHFTYSKILIPFTSEKTHCVQNTLLFTNRSYAPPYLQEAEIS